MYVYISQTCQQQAKLYQIEQKVEELASWIKDGSRQDFVKLFEIFQHPYYQSLTGHHIPLKATPATLAKLTLAYSPRIYRQGYSQH